MKTLFIALLSICTSLVFAQNTVTWKGGTPGNETAWEVAKNWSNNQVPNEFSKVIIVKKNSGHNAQPVISHDIEVNSIEIHSNASLVIKTNASILIDGQYKYTEGIANYGGLLENHGTIILKNIDGPGIANIDEVPGSGIIIIDNKSANARLLANKQ